MDFPFYVLFHYGLADLTVDRKRVFESAKIYVFLSVETT